MNRQTNLRTRLQCIEDDLMKALSGDPEDATFLVAFQESWAILQSDVHQFLRETPSNLEFEELVYSVASRVSILVESFLDLNAKTAAISSSFRSDLDNIFGCISLDDRVHNVFGSMANHSYRSSDTYSHLSNDLPVEDARSTLSNPPSRDLHSSPCHSFIAPAYWWLLKNLHNPYPPHDIKQSISKDAGVLVENVSAWFTNVRRRMGWTALCREYFHNCRADTLDAAYRVFVQEDPKRDLGPEIVHAFMVVKVTAEGLYSSKFKRSTLAGQLDVVVKDMTDEDRLRMEKIKIQEAVEEKKRKEVEKELRRQQRAKKRETLKAARSASKSYPSPVDSPYESSVPALEDSFTDESEEEEDSVLFPKTLAGNKRRASSSSASTMSTPLHCDERPLKRHRSNKTPEIVACSSISALPSPPSEVDTNHGVFDYWSPEVVELPVAPNTLPTPAQSHNRKRRLSDGATQGTPKRPRGFVGPRLHAVSDPLPKTNDFTADFDDWFMANFEIPPAVADEVPDPSTLLDVDVECYNWSSIQDCHKLPVDDIAMLASPPYSTQPYNSLNMDPNPFSITDINPLSTGDNLDELYHDIFGANSHYPPPYSSQPVDGDASSLTCITSDSGMSSALPSMSFSDDLFSDGGAWSHLPSYTDAIGSFNPSSLHSSIPESAHPLNLSSILSEIDLSMLQLPISSTPDIPHTNEEATRLADKQAKLEQLRMLEEAKRRLEAELASDV